jgi:hypothetical protein
MYWFVCDFLRVYASQHLQFIVGQIVNLLCFRARTVEDDPSKLHFLNLRQFHSDLWNNYLIYYFHSTIKSFEQSNKIQSIKIYNKALNFILNRDLICKCSATMKHSNRLHQ